MKDNLELERKDIRIDPEVQVDDDDLKQINFMLVEKLIHLKLYLITLIH